MNIILPRQPKEHYVYICARGGQCKRICNEYCLYTHDFFKSKLFHTAIKPVEPIKFIMDKKGEWYEIDFNWDKNLPEKLRATPERYCQHTYDWLCDYEGVLL